jgi:Amidohydrolase family
MIMMLAKGSSRTGRFATAEPRPCASWVLVVLLVSSAQAQETVKPATWSILLKNVILIDGTGGPPRAVSIGVRGVQIVQIAPNLSGAADDVIEPLKGEELFVIPGLYDMHVHVYPSTALRTFKLLIAFGVTGIRMMDANYLMFKNQIDSELQSDKGLRAVPFIYPCDYQYVLQGAREDDDWVDQVRTFPDLFERAARNAERASQGKTFIKVYDKILPETLHGLSIKAKREGFGLAGHCPIFVDAHTASIRGLKSLEHLYGVSLACSSKRDVIRNDIAKDVYTLPGETTRPVIERKYYKSLIESYDEKRAAEVFATFRTKHTAQCPTLVTWWIRANVLRPEFRSDPERAALYKRAGDLTNSKPDVEELERINDRRPEKGFDLRLMSPVTNVSSIPTTGRALIIVADVDNVLHFRMFDADGRVVVDTDEKMLPEQARQVAELRKQLAPLWPPHTLNAGEKGKVIIAVISMVGRTPEDLWFDESLRLVGEMRKHHVEILAGTDSGGPAYCFHGRSLHDELALLVKAGLSPMEAIQSATSEPAEFLEEDRRGTVKERTFADLVVLKANPLSDISNTRKIDAVIAQGRLYKRNDLDRLLREALK